MKLPVRLRLAWPRRSVAVTETLCRPLPIRFFETSWLAVVEPTTASQLVSTKRIGRGRHSVSVTATDRRGQASRSRTANFTVEAGLPSLRIRVRRSGRRVTVSRAARDRGPSGLDYVQIDWGDGARSSRRARAVHTYKRGRFTLRVTAVDRAANRTVKSKALRIP